MRRAVWQLLVVLLILSQRALSERHLAEEPTGSHEALSRRLQVGKKLPQMTALRLRPKYQPSIQRFKVQISTSEDSQRHNHRPHRDRSRELSTEAHLPPHKLHDTILTDEEVAAGSPTGAFILFAFHDPIQNIVQAYVQFELKTVRATGGLAEGEKISSCIFSDKDSNNAVTEPASVWFPEKAPDEVTYGMVQCNATRPQSTHMAVASDSGKRMTNLAKLTAIQTDRHGSVAACSQPLHTDRTWLQDWVEHYAALGVSKVYMHVPTGPHIDAFFDPTLRKQRLEMASQHLDSTPDDIGDRPLQKFIHPTAEWHEFQSNPKGSYGKTAIFQSCLARARYAYDYIAFFDVDEFLEIRHSGAVRGGLLPEYLDRNMPANMASLRFHQYNFFEHCRVLDSGPFAGRFLLRRQDLGQFKAIERVKAVNWTHIHGVVEVNQAWVDTFIPGEEWPDNHEPKVKEVDVSSAFLKHLRPSTDKTLHENPCAFGLSAEDNLSPERTLVLIH